MRLVKRFTIAERKVLVLNYANDCRYSDESVITTHDKYIEYINFLGHISKPSRLHNYQILKDNVPTMMLLQ